MRQRRSELGLSQRIVANAIGLSRDQLNRIEQERVAPRFSPTWAFCELTSTNPLWLAFGSPYQPIGFAAGDMSDIPPGTPFLDAMRGIEVDYRTYRQQLLQIPGPPRIRFMMAFDPPREKNVAPGGLKEYLRSDMAVEAFGWENLRARLDAVTSGPGSKAALAHRFNVSPAAVSQWLSGASAPTADTTLRLLEWVTAEEETIKQKKRAGSAVTRPALKTRNRESTSHEKTKSGP
jgi:transcriptional regulator with XRE-family HTH domain